MTEIDYETDLHRGGIFTKPNWATPFIIVEVINGNPALLIANIFPSFHRGEMKIHSRTVAHCSSFPAAGVFPSMNTDTITVILPSLSVEAGDFIAAYGSDSGGDWYVIEALTEDRGLMTLTAAAIPQPIFFNGERLQ